MRFLDTFFANTLSGWQWAALAAIPPAILLLYFLKLRRQPLEVPSTYLWHKTIEDLHVNSIWQRLRQSLLLFLQLLLILLVAMACLRPGWHGSELTGNRFVFLIDTSASMSATDVAPNRLEAAKQRTLAMIDQMKSGDVAMIVSFSDTAKTEQPFTDSRRLLRNAVQKITQTNRGSDLLEALRAAAGLANTGRTSDNSAASIDDRVAEARPATLYLLSDGGFARIPDFAVGNLDPHYLPIGGVSPENVGIVNFSVEKNPEKPDQQQAFGRLENHGGDEIKVTVSLHRDETLVDAKSVTIPARGEAGVGFDLVDLETGVLKLSIAHQDSLALDNVAYTALNIPRPAKVLIVTPRNDALQLALRTEECAKIANVTLTDPSVLENEAHLESQANGTYDLIIFDQCVPPKMPQANTLFIGRVPPAEGWSKGEQGTPLIIDVDRVHPLMKLLEMNRVRIADGFALKGPRGAATLLDADLGPLIVIAPRQGFEDAAVGFEIIGRNDKGELVANTDWPRHYSFPVFVQNVLEYLGGGGVATQTTPSVRPGQPITLRTESNVEKIFVQPPDGARKEILRDSPNTFVVGDTLALGVYDVFEGKTTEPSQRFAVNLFDSRESNLAVAEAIKIGHNEVDAQTSAQPKRKEFWKWLLMLGLVVLIFEWYVYNRRVYF